MRARHPAARFLMVGARPGESIRQLHNGAEVLVAEWVPGLEPCYGRDALVVVPMLLGRHPDQGAGGAGARKGGGHAVRRRRGAEPREGRGAEDSRRADAFAGLRPAAG